MGNGEAVMTMDFNHEEVNCIASHPKGYLAAADDSGEVKVGTLADLRCSCTLALEC
jgi:hypothetical protein